MFKPETHNKSIQKRFEVMQDTIQEHKRQEKKSRLKFMLTLNPYLTLKKPEGDEEVDNAPQYNEENDGNAPSPRQSEYITHPLLS